MSKQSEKPGTTPEQLAKTFGSDPAGIKCSGGQIMRFREGWAVNIMSSNFGRAHYFARSKINIAFADAICDFNVVAQVRWLYGEGNHGRCKNCERKLHAK